MRHDPSFSGRTWMPGRWLKAAALALAFAVSGGVPDPALAQAAKPGAPAAPAAAAAPAAMPAAATSLVRVPDGRLLAPDIARIVMRGELVVAMLGVDTPPFFYEKKGELMGLEVDLAKSIAKELGVNVRFNRNAKSFNGVVDTVARGDADIGVSKLSRTLARTQVISFSQPYLVMNHALILNRVKFAQFARDRALPEVIRGFNGSIGVIAKSSFEDYAKRYFPNAKIKTYPDWPLVLKALKQGDVIGAYRDEFEVKRILKEDPTESLLLRTVTFKDLEDTLGIAVGIGDPVLLAFINEFLTQRTDKLTVNKVLGAIEK
ncbi:MAG TPA: ABC transporter substrate-binding protein [Ramlibacter sp.]|uniref:ABC transporter substrate-binding protein n=1 Tax=Ramlibacter sp. TaxID=1917967 RepID=UPI002C3463DC|nr:ABC transporter substrate-binding protein [Ramlibacter sp.]HVZ43836.1 ABC transporter substrate-binding protein [Ramlibacter sp.]